MKNQHKFLGIITDDFYPIKGGMGKHVYELFQRLNKSHVFVFSPCPNKLQNHITIKSPAYKKGKNISLSLWLHFNINKLIKKYNLSKINVQCGPGGLFLTKRLKIPVIATCHHTYWQQSNYIKSQFWKKLFVPFERKTYKNADKILCVSNDTKRILIEKYKIPKEKITMIFNGIDTKEFYPIPNIKKEKHSLLYVGRIDKRKGVDFLIRSMPGIIKKIPDVKLYIGGKGKDLEKIKRYVSKNNLSEKVTFLGFVKEEKLNEWYNKVECVIVPSVFEGFGLTVIEAMAAGTLVIGTNVDGIRTIIKNKENGFLVEYNNTEELAETVKTVLNQNNKKIIQRAFKDIDEKYTWDKVFEKYNNEIIM